MESKGFFWRQNDRTLGFDYLHGLLTILLIRIILIKLAIIQRYLLGIRDYLQKAKPAISRFP